MCSSGETVKDLYKMLCPKSANYKQIMRAVEPYDDGAELSKKTVNERMEVLRQQFAKNMYPRRNLVIRKPQRRSTNLSKAPR